MGHEIPTRGLQLRSLLKIDGHLELSLAEVDVAPPAHDEIVVRIEASPINPSDLGLLLGAADLATLAARDGRVTAVVPPIAMTSAVARVGISMPVGGEGAGVVIAAGVDPAARALMGRTVALRGGAMWAEYRTLKTDEAFAMPDGITPAEAAAAFVNPLTALGMVDTLRREGHTALVHTAAASNLGRMLQKICLQEGVELVNIVRSKAHAEILHGLGATRVVVSTSPSFQDDLNRALLETGATLAFDATGGGPLADQILTGMEAAANAKAGGFSLYGSSSPKQVYIYGGLDTRPTELTRRYGLNWGLGGWLLTPFLARIGPEATAALRRRVAAELKTTFASRYTAEISLSEALEPPVIAAYSRRATGEKYLINPAKGLPGA